MPEAFTDNSGPAFPMPSGPEPRDKSTTHYNEGMSLRDWFAGQAIVVVLSDGDCPAMAERAYKVADAMLAERKRRTDD